MAETRKIARERYRTRNSIDCPRIPEAKTGQMNSVRDTLWRGRGLVIGMDAQCFITHHLKPAWNLRCLFVEFPHVPLDDYPYPHF